MNERATQILQDAWKRNALRGTFVHFQRENIDRKPDSARPMMHKVYSNAQRLQKGLKAQRIKTDIFLCLSGRNPIISAEKLKSIGLKSGISPFRVIPENDTVFDFNGYADKMPEEAIQHYQTIERPTLIACGVYKDWCFKGAIEAFLEKVADINLIIAYEAVNSEHNYISSKQENDPEEYKRELVRSFGKEDQIHMGQIGQIFDAIDLARNDLA